METEEPEIAVEKQFKEVEEPQVTIEEQPAELEEPQATVLRSPKAALLLLFLLLHPL